MTSVIPLENIWGVLRFSNKWWATFWSSSANKSYSKRRCPKWAVGPFQFCSGAVFSQIHRDFLFIFRSHHESWFRSPQKIIILVVGDLLLTGASGALTSWGSWPNDSKNRLMEPDLLYNTGINISTVPYIGGPEWVDTVIRRWLIENFRSMIPSGWLPPCLQ